MAETRRFDTRKLAIGILLAVAILAMGLVLFRINQNQSTLQTVVETNTQQIKKLKSKIH